MQRVQYVWGICVDILTAIYGLYAQMEYMLLLALTYNDLWAWAQYAALTEQLYYWEVLYNVMCGPF